MMLRNVSINTEALASLLKKSKKPKYFTEETMREISDSFRRALSKIDELDEISPDYKALCKGALKHDYVSVCRVYDMTLDNVRFDYDLSSFYFFENKSSALSKFNTILGKNINTLGLHQLLKGRTNAMIYVLDKKFIIENLREFEFYEIEIDRILASLIEP